MPAPALSLLQHSLSKSFAQALSPGHTSPDGASSWWRLLDRRRSAAGPTAGGERRLFDRRTKRLNRRIQQALRHRRHLSLGSHERPYLPCLWQGVSAASILRAHEGLNVRIVTAASSLIEELPLWRELDQHHAVVIEIPLMLGRGTALNGQYDERLQLAGRVAELGIETCLTVSFGDGVSSRQLRDLFDQVNAYRIADVRLGAEEHPLSREQSLLFRQLRLQSSLAA